MRSLDLNLLVVAAALYRHHNVSRAAEELGLSQSAVSHALTRLRDQFQDPLFVRTAKGMALTKYAREIQVELLDIVHRMELLASRQSEFRPLEATTRVSIASTDYFEVLVMAKLQALLAVEAPNLQISLRPTRGDLPKRDLEDGTIDLAVAGFYRDLPEGFYQSKLYTDQFQCAVGQGHPLFKNKTLAREDYAAARHALITLRGDFREKRGAATSGATAGGSRSRGRAKASKERKIVYGSYSFTGMAWVLQGSALLLTAPGLLIAEYKKYFPLQTWPSPIDKGQIDIRMVWHAQTHEDPLHQWLRAKIKQIF